MGWQSERSRPGRGRGTITNTNCVVEGKLELVIKRGDIDNKRLVTWYKTTLKEPNLWWDFFFFFFKCTSRGTYVHSGTPGPRAQSLVGDSYIYKCFLRHLFGRTW